MIKVYPDIVLKAKANNLQPNGFRLWFIAKAFCGGRGGAIPVKDFRKHLMTAQGVKRATLSRWIRAAKALELISTVKTKKGDYFELASWTKGAAIAGCERLDNPKFIALEVLLSHSWLSYVNASYQVRFGDKPVSRETIKALTGVPIRTQQYRDKRASVRQVENVTVLGKHQELAESNPEFLSEKYDIEEIRTSKKTGRQYMPGVFINRATGELCQQLPNSRELPSCITQARRGRTSKVNKELKALSIRGAVAEKEPVIPSVSISAKQAQQQAAIRYSNSPKETKRITRKYRDLDSPKRPGRLVIYERWRALPGKVQGWLTIEPFKEAFNVA